MRPCDSSIHALKDTYSIPFVHSLVPNLNVPVRINNSRMSQTVPLHHVRSQIRTSRSRNRRSPCPSAWPGTRRNASKSSSRFNSTSGSSVAEGRTRQLGKPNGAGSCIARLPKRVRPRLAQLDQVLPCLSGQKPSPVPVPKATLGAEEMPLPELSRMPDRHPAGASMIGVNPLSPAPSPAAPPETADPGCTRSPGQVGRDFRLAR